MPEETAIMGALSVLIGAKVRPFTDYERKHGTPDQVISIKAFLPNVYNSESSRPSMSLKSQLVGGTSAQKKTLFVKISDFLHPRYDYDFTTGSDSDDCKRGGEKYTRPWGWYRVALKVLDKYPDGNTWLGPDGMRSNSAPGEWPVSFHGTSIEGAEGITSSNYTAGPRQLYGRGIYSTPDIKETAPYVKDFTDTKTGKKYKVIMQNRINPSKRVITARPKYWLIPVPEGTSAEEQKKIVDASIRPYGILIQEVKN